MCVPFWSLFFGRGREKEDNKRQAKEILEMVRQLEECRENLKAQKRQNEVAQRKISDISRALKESKSDFARLERDQLSNEAKVRQADSKVQQAETRAQQAESKARQADARAQQAHNRVQQAESRVLQAEAKVEQANKRNNDVGEKERATTQTAQADPERETLEKKVSSLKSDLQSSRDHISSLQPLPPVILGPEAGRQFSSLCEIVEEWVQTKLGDAIYDRKLFTAATIDNQAGTELLSLVSLPGREAFQVPDSDEYNVIAAIMMFLCREIFDKDFYCHMGELELMGSLQGVIQKLKPPRGRKAIRTWRRETLTALANSSHFPSIRQQRIQELTAHLKKILSIFRPGVDGNRAMSSIETSIIQPAVDLAEKLQLSVDTFSVEWTSSKNFTGNESFSAFQCQNILPPKRKLKFPAATQGNCISYICDIAPQLVQQLAHVHASEAPKIQKEAKILVAVTKQQDGPYEGEGLQMKDGKYVTLLGHLDAYLSQGQS